MKRLLILFSIFILTSSERIDKKDRSESNFRVDILYNRSHHFKKNKYSIDDNGILIYQTHLDIKKDSFVEFNRVFYKRYDKKRLVSFIKSVDWKSIPSKLEKTMIDGNGYTIDISIENETYSFHIHGVYNATFDSLFTICNELIPSKNGRKKYHINYDERK